MSPPSPNLSPELWASPKSDRKMLVLALAILVLPFLLGAGGSIALADEAIGPLVTLGVWVVLVVVTLVRGARMSWIELLPVVGALVILQLLLDLHTPHLGDVVIAALHAIFVVVALVRR